MIQLDEVEARGVGAVERRDRGIGHVVYIHPDRGNEGGRIGDAQDDAGMMPADGAESGGVIPTVGGAERAGAANDAGLIVRVVVAGVAVVNPQGQALVVGGEGTGVAGGRNREILADREVFLGIGGAAAVGLPVGVVKPPVAQEIAIIGLSGVQAVEQIEVIVELEAGRAQHIGAAVRTHPVVGIGDPPVSRGTQRPPRIGSVGVGTAAGVVINTAMLVVFKPIEESEDGLLDNERGAGAGLAPRAVGDHDRIRSGAAPGRPKPA